MVFYFSGTGNTKWVAQQIAGAIGEELLYIPDLIREDRYHFTLGKDERIGFCFPTHGWQPPRIVRDFISRITVGQRSEDTFCWALTTCGDNMGEAMTILNKELAANKQLQTAGGRRLEAETLFSVIMPESYVCLPFMYTDTPEREREKIDQARLDLAAFVKVVANRQTGHSRLKLGLTPWTFSHVIGAYFNRCMITDKKFTVDSDVCIHCGRCAAECPVADIEFDNTPRWKNNGTCTCCLSCYHHCPVHAINYGTITRKRGQYYFGKSWK